MYKADDDTAPMLVAMGVRCSSSCSTYLLEIHVSLCELIKDAIHPQADTTTREGIKAGSDFNQRR